MPRGGPLRTVGHMTAIVLVERSFPVPVARCRRLGRADPTARGRLFAALLVVMVTAAALSPALIRPGSAPTPRRNAPAVHYPGPPSSEEVLAHQVP